MELSVALGTERHLGSIEKTRASRPSLFWPDITISVFERALIPDSMMDMMAFTITCSLKHYEFTLTYQIQTIFI